ncbi:MAG TPA: DUF1993 domain-containing protein [Woeseiaceae bacterium]|nr:DUF1993 domain-containing protein [Woeseiaceae bacterium]
MSISIYDQVIAPLQKALNSFDKIVSKAEAFAEERKIDPELLVQGRLRPDMLPFVAQVRIATDTAKGAAGRLAGVELPKWADDEATFAEVHERIGKAIDYLASFKAAQFEGAEKKTIELKFGRMEMTFTGTEYITGFVLPNFYFHYATAYDILRFNGLDIGKKDFLGAT